MVSYWLALPIGISVGIAIVSLAYMLASLFSSEALRAWTRLELGELIFSAILVIILLLALDHAGDILRPVAHLNSPQEVAYLMYERLEAPLQQVLNNLIQDSFRLTRIISFNYNGQMGFPYLTPTYSSSPGAGLSPLMMQLQGGIDTTSMTLLLAKALRVGFLFLLVAVGDFLLPLAVLLRFIPFTRKLGGTLLGIALAVWLVFPAAAAFSMQMGNSFKPNDYPFVFDDPGPPPLRSVTCNVFMGNVFSLGEIGGPAIICGILELFLPGTYGVPPSPAPVFPGEGCTGLLGDIWWLVQFLYEVANSVVLSVSSLNINGADAVDKIYWPMVRGVMPPVVQWNFAVLLMIIMMLAPTIVLARNFAQVLGGEAQFYGLAKLV